MTDSNIENRPPATVTFEPSIGSERLIVIDVIRGVAVLGILAMNILSIGLPGAARLNPTIAGGFDGANRFLWWVGYLLFDEKMIALFSMLFGAGLVLQTDRAVRKGHSPSQLFYRRMFVLLIIGLAHAYLMWDGDILVTYALCGMIIYPLRRLSPPILISIGVLVMLVSIPLGLLIGNVFADARKASQRIEQLDRVGAPVSESEKVAAGNWAEIRRSFQPTAEELAAELARARAEGYFEHLRRKAPEALAVHTQLFIGAFLWLVGGRMLIGMALMKLGVFSGIWSRGFYLFLMFIGYGIGLPLVLLCAKWLIDRDFEPEAIFGGGLLWNSFAGMLVALGHIGFVVSAFKAGWFTSLTMRLMAVGRMALTNYLLQSFICCILFCGWGFAWIGRMDRTQLYAVMFSIWCAQLIYSPIWLSHFTFGPAEWLWRTLSYGRWQQNRQPLRAQVANE